LETLWKRFQLDHGAARIEATTAGQEEARWLGVAPGSALLLRRIRYIDRTGRPVVAGYSVDRGDLVRYSVHIPLVRETIEPLTRGRRSERVVRLRWEVAPPEAAEH